MGIVLLEITVHAHLHVLENPIMRFAVLWENLTVTPLEPVDRQTSSSRDAPPIRKYSRPAWPWTLTFLPEHVTLRVVDAVGGSTEVEQSGPIGYCETVQKELNISSNFPQILCSEKYSLLTGYI